jgi:hypothetical protein
VKKELFGDFFNSGEKEEFENLMNMHCHIIPISLQLSIVIAIEKILY